MKTTFALLLALCFVGTACASKASTGSLDKPLPTTVVVDNQGVLDMTIYILRAAQRIRLGIAGGLTKTRLTIPASVVYGAVTLRFLADPIGGSRNPVSEEIAISEGDEIGLRIPPR